MYTCTFSQEHIIHQNKMSPHLKMPKIFDSADFLFSKFNLLYTVHKYD